MNKKTLITMLVIILAIASAAVYVLTRPTKSEETNEISQSSSTNTSNHEVASQTKPGSYVDYSSDLASRTSGRKILFFHAPWCPQCRELDKSIKSSEIPAEVTIFKVDYDSNQELRKKYDVTLQTTLVKIDDSGNKISSYVAYSEPTFEAVKRELLP